jgi:hypothetical protein
MFYQSSGPPLLPDDSDMESMPCHYLDGRHRFVLLFGTALGWLLIIIFMVTVQQKLSRLRADFQLLSDELTALKTAEETRLMREIHDPKSKGRTRRKKADVSSPPLDPQ